MAKKPYKVVIKNSPRKEKKKVAIFYDKDGTKIRTVHFGAKGMSDYTKHKDKERKSRYLKRHKSNEKWRSPMTAGALSRWVLWNKPSYKRSVSDYKRRFKLK